MNTEPTPISRYMLIFRDPGADLYRAMSPEERQQLLTRWNAWFDGLAKQGKVEDGRPLEREGRIISATGGRIVDGPFAEAKEAIGGFFLLTVGSLEEATEIAKQCPSLHLGLTVEVRPVAGCCPVLRPTQRQQSSQELINA